MMTKKIIVDTLTFAEIVEIAKTDIVPIQSQMLKAQKHYFREIITRRPKGELWFKPLAIERSTGITWFLRIFTKGYADYKRNGALYLLYGVFHYRGGLFAISVPEGPRGGKCSVYLPHFFQRYNERFCSGAIASEIETIHEYFKYNTRLFPIDLPKQNGGVFTTTEQGAALGEINEGVYILKTYIPPELMYAEQVKARDAGLFVINKLMSR